jgi:S-adenosylmethionine decarboxylase
MDLLGKNMKKLFLFFVFFISTALHADNYAFKGDHFFASYGECDQRALENVEALTQAMLDAAKASGATVLNYLAHPFPPHGLTMVILLSESHASIHTYPEHGACFVDLFTCGEHCDANRFDEQLRSYLRPKEVNSKHFIRHQGIEEKLR